VQQVKFPERKFDELRILCQNVPTLGESPILQMDHSYSEEEWKVKLYTNEIFKALGGLIVLQEYLA